MSPLRLGKEVLTEILKKLKIEWENFFLVSNKNVLNKSYSAEKSKDPSMLAKRCFC